MNLRGYLKLLLFKDTTFSGEYSAIRKLLPADCPRSVVDVGAADGFYGSNSYPFLARGWRGLLIEPHPGSFEKAQNLYRGKSSVVCLNLACAESDGERPLYFGTKSDSHSTLCTEDSERFRKVRSENYKMVQVRRLDSVLAEQRYPTDFGVLSIDAECMDYEVLLGIDLGKWHPQLIITEDYKSKDPQKFQYLQNSGYRHAGQCDPNSIWLRDA
jgi:FkbM family methyltransferase